jgi:3' exoribonuclease, RNase T-like
MIYTFDAEFIDTPLTSELISFGIVNEKMQTRYFEFDFDQKLLTPWLDQNVVPHLSGKRTTFYDAVQELTAFVTDPQQAEFWAFYGAYDWYWLCRLFGGMMSVPEGWPRGYTELAYLVEEVPAVSGPEHHAENDAISTMECFKQLQRKGVVREGMHRRL